MTNSLSTDHMDPFIEKLLTSSEPERQQMLKRATDAEREVLICAVSERQDTLKERPVKRNYFKIVSTFAALLLIKAFQELFLYIHDG